MRGLWADGFADLHHGEIGLVIFDVGELTVSFEQGDSCLILSQQEMALGFSEHQLEIALELGPVTEG